MIDESLTKLKPLIFWEGFPPCALMIKQVADLYGDRLIILGTRPVVPFEGLEEILGHKIEWLDHPDDIWKRREEYADRNFIVHTGWSHKGWLKFDRWIKKRGARVVVTVDNQFKGNFRQIIGSLWFRLWLRRHFDVALVPGRSAARLLRFLGMPLDRIYSGYYGAYEEIYQAGPPLKDRREEFLYVGQLIKRKGVDILLEAYNRYRQDGGKWSLRIIGSGPLECLCKGDGIVFEGFAQARKVAAHMKEARCLVIPSREDHWPTVVSEALASGMAVVASRWVGSAEDLVRTGVNGWVFQKMTSKDLSLAMTNISQWSDDSLKNAQAVSLGLAACYRSGTYAATFQCAARLFVAKHSKAVDDK